MNRAQKAEFVETLSARIQNAEFIALTVYRGATSNEANAFRRDLEKHGLDMVVVKNTLAKRALAGTEKEPLGEVFTGMTGIIISGEDGIGAAKAIEACIDKKGKIQVKNGFFEGELLGENAVKTVAALPGREELLSLLLRTIQAGPRKVMLAVKAPARDLMYLLKNYENKLAEAEGGE